MSKSSQTRYNACQVLPHLVIHPLLLMMSLLVARNYRLHRIFNNPQLKKVKITHTDLLKTTLPFVFLNSLIITVPLIISPVESRLTEAGGILSWECRLSDETSWLIWVELVMFFCVVVVGAFMVRKLWGKKLPFGAQNESKHVVGCFCTIVLVLMVTVPMQLVSLAPDASFLSLSFILLSCE